MHNYLIVIPARYDSTRFPGKPLVDICGKSMIQRVWEKCVEALNADQVIIATDDDRIVKHCEKKKMNTILTSKKCLTGTDRIYEVSKKIKSQIYVNVQGDEPLISSEDILTIINQSKASPDSVVNGMANIKSSIDHKNPNIPKVVVDKKNNLLFMSRGAIPVNKNLEFISAKKQVCIYAFPYEALNIYGSMSQKTPLEEIEDIEILRFLEMGINVKMVEVSDSSIAVDVPEDLEKIISAIND